MKRTVIMVVKSDILMIHPYTKHKVKDERFIEWKEEVLMKTMKKVVWHRSFKKNRIREKIPKMITRPDRLWVRLGTKPVSRAQQVQCNIKTQNTGIPPHTAIQLNILNEVSLLTGWTRWYGESGQCLLQITNIAARSWGRWSSLHRQTKCDFSSQ